MAISAVIEFGSNDVKRYNNRYLVSDCRFLFARPYNGFTPSRPTRCERIEVTVIAPGKEDLTLIKWFSSQDVLSGRIVIGMPNDNSQNSADTQELYFEAAKCFSLSEVYDIDVSRRRQFKIALTAESIETDGVTFNRI